MGSKWTHLRGAPPPQKTQFFEKISKSSFYHRKMRRSFLFQNIYGFSQNDQFFIDLSEKTSTLLACFPRNFRVFFRVFPSEVKQKMFRKVSSIRLCRAFFADHFGIKKLWISLRNDDAIVKIKNVGNSLKSHFSC